MEKWTNIILWYENGWPWEIERDVERGVERNAIPLAPTTVVDSQVHVMSVHIIPFKVKIQS